ncbi:hypothetical protein CISIN_1g041420mg [Citrus sinensis]|uniref:Dof zinc finger protein n=1 Tax=Citrus sinensis TaxID=2711 RepID=A0A067EZI0_CITSI|nr:hypothetical protein CISIN_1g041420mg [Citrus sinensis]
MSSENILTTQAVMTKEENQNPAGNRKTASTRPQEQALKCPRCDSPNTKFCYYNNYSLTQPRHFCKTCRRYWTKGGALRNVPIGGGCRKNKKIKSSSRLSVDSKDSASSSEIGGFKFFHGLSPAMDFQLGGLSFPRLNPSSAGICSQFSSFGDATSPSYFGLDPSASSANHPLTGFNYPLSSIVANTFVEQFKKWQQRLAMLFGGENQKETTVASAQLETQTQKPQPILFQNLEISSKPEAPAVGNSRKEGASGESTATEWFFGNSYAPVTAGTPTTTSSGGNGGNDNTINNWNNGAQGWSDLHRYSGLP